MKVIFGKYTYRLEDVCKAMEENRKVLMIYEDAKTWASYGKEVTSEMLDNMVSNWNEYDGNYNFYIDYFLLDNFSEVELPAGEYSMQTGVKIV